ncbi:MAG TPA: alpha/beta fold hydrolase [Candidatus Dormibacteraeota bacterium]|nr:alpha/beta fold hydrolase [Candidatus Dormibacteraeota bacterium]
MASLLLVHGAWHGAWCWEDRMVPRLHQAGHEVRAVDLRHHGAEDPAGCAAAGSATTSPTSTPRRARCPRRWW